MTEITLTQNSYLTLERIAQRDNVDFAYRNKQINQVLWSSAIIGAGAIALGTYAGSELYHDGFGVWDSLLLAAGAFGTFAGVGCFISTLSTKKAFRQDPHQIVDHHPYYLGDKVSLEATMIERRYGKRVKPVNHLNQLPDPHGKKPLYYFIDQLVVKELTKMDYTEEDTSYDGDGGNTTTRTEHYKGEVTLTRRNRARKFNYHYTKSMPRELSQLLEQQEPFALLCKQGSEGNALDIIRVYSPHP